MKVKQFAYLAIAMSILISFSPVLADSDYGYHMMGDYGYGMGIFGWVFMLLFFVALVLLIIWLLKQVQENPKRK